MVSIIPWMVSKWWENTGVAVISETAFGLHECAKVITTKQTNQRKRRHNWNLATQSFTKAKRPLESQWQHRPVLEGQLEGQLGVVRPCNRRHWRNYSGCDLLDWYRKIALEPWTLYETFCTVIVLIVFYLICDLVNNSQLGREGSRRPINGSLRLSSISTKMV